MITLIAFLLSSVLMIASVQTLPDVLALMVGVKTVAPMLDCSQRHVWRMVDTGRMPKPIKLGALVRWPRSTIDKWIADGCPRCDGK